MYFEDDKVARYYGQGFDAGYALAVHEIGLTKTAIDAVVRKTARDIMWLELESKSLKSTMGFFFKNAIPGAPEGQVSFEQLNKYKNRLRVVRKKLRVLRLSQRVFKAILKG